MKAETFLLNKINKGIAIEKLRRFDILQNILKSGKSTIKEKKEFELLVDFIERKEAERLKNMFSLAKIRKLTIPQLRKKLNINSNSANV